MIPANYYVRHMLVGNRRLALSSDSRVPAWQSRATPTSRTSRRRRRGYLRLFTFRLRPAHGGS